MTATAAFASSHQPPLVPGLPLLGNALELFQNPLTFIRKRHAEYGPIFRFRALNREFMVLAGVEANEFLASTSDEFLSNHAYWSEIEAEYAATQSLISADGELHRTLRRIMQPGMGRSAVAPHIGLYLKVVQNALSEYKVGDEIPVLYLMRRMIMEQLGVMMAGRAPAELVDDIIYFVQTMLKVRIVQKWPTFMLRTPRYRRAQRVAMELGRELIATAKNNPNPETRFVTDTVQASIEHPELFPTEGDLIIAVLSPFIAGLDTVASQLTFMLYALLKHPDVMEQVVADADALFANGQPGMNDFRKATALHHASMEALRRYPTTPAITRRVIKPFEFQGYSIPVGTDVLFGVTATHFMPELFADPDKFDITRYDEPRNEHKQRGAFAPYGLGPHVCLGAGLAEVAMMLDMAALLRAVRVELIDPKQDIQVRQDVTLSLGNGFRVRLTERRHSLIDA